MLKPRSKIYGVILVTIDPKVVSSRLKTRYKSSSFSNWLYLKKSVTPPLLFVICSALSVSNNLIVSPITFSFVEGCSQKSPFDSSLVKALLASFKY